MRSRIIFRKTLLAAAVSAIALGGGALGYELHGSQAHAAVVAATSAAAALPDFTGIVAQHGAAVVNITVEQPARAAALASGANPFAGTPFEQFFRELPQADARPQFGMGSGFVVREDGYIVTNAHVVGDAKSVKVKLTDKREYTGKVVGRDSASDLALVKIEAKDLPVVRLANAGAVHVGEWVVAIGAPYGFENTVTAGIVSAKGRMLPNDTYVPFIQTDVAVNPGNSGGPLFNLKGEVVGINSQIFSQSGGYQGLSFAIPADIAKNVVDQLRERGAVTRGWIGVSIQEVDYALARSFGLDRPHGALVASVVGNGPAKAAGLKAGDVIVAYDRKPIESSADLPQEVGVSAPGASARVDIVRNGTPMSLQVRVATLPKSDAAPAQEVAAAGGGRLGIAVADLTAQQKSELGIDHGVQVREVAPGAAARAGVQPGDVILQLGGKSVDSVAMLREQAAKLPDHKPTALLVRRGEATLFLPLTPGNVG